MSKCLETDTLLFHLIPGPSHCLNHDPAPFSGPVASYAGIGRFVMGLLDEIEIVSPEEFRKYVRKKVKGVRVSSTFYWHYSLPAEIFVN